MTTLIYLSALFKKDYHCSAEDTLLYVSVKPDDLTDIRKLEAANDKPNFVN